ncbi:MAG: radical SAM protein [Candidatus Viridilinea halotolerans]|uniref:Radical SAM protein n=1 Tax=Candidatus Viridilinea halotolerans TaxID=2491704 RepID=A0A426TQF1_9CHLR|nr:MAG: radical SAM protein [Candidatus Viridilinea halotolerans]
MKHLDPDYGPSVVRTPELGTIYLNVQPHSLTLSQELQATFAFDGEGRPLSCFLDGRNYRFGLSGAILLKTTHPDGKLRRLLAPDEAEELAAAVHTRAARIATAVASGCSPTLQAWLERISAWDSARRTAACQAFAATYRPISIVPPDHYQAVVIQATEGCSWNQCSFCSFYRDRVFRIKTPAALQEHIDQIKALLGRGLALRRSIFLGDANALIVPQTRLRELLAVVNAALPPTTAGGPRGLYAFLDIFGGEIKSVTDYVELKEDGIKRIYLGLETGDDEVFRLLNKPGSPAECVEVVQRIKAAGISVGVILLAGAGGIGFAERHLSSSLATLRAMNLSQDDLVYISPLIPPATSDYALQSATLGLQPLDSAMMNAQLAALRSGAIAASEGQTRVALYHIEEWLY